MIRLLLLLSVCMGLVGQISSIPGATPGGGSGAPNVTASSIVAVTSLTMNISSLNLSSLDTLIVQCWSGVSAPFSPVTITSINPASTTSITINFASTANVVCRANSNGGAGPQGVPGATGPAGANGTNGTNGTNGAISQIQDEGSGLPVQPIIDFVGAGVTATNGSGKTIVTIPGGPGGGNYQTVQSAGVAQPARPALNFLASTGGVTACIDDIANSRTNCSFGADTSIVLTQTTAQSGAPWLCNGTGTAIAQTCSLTPPLVGYTSGQVIQYRPGTSNATTQTIAINGLTAISILRHDGTALQAGDLTSGRQYPITYDGTAFRLPPAGAGGASLLPTLTEINNADYVDYGTAAQFVLDTSVSGKVMMTGANAASSGWWNGRRRTIAAGAWSRVFAISWQVEGNSGGIGVFFTDGTAYENCYIAAASGEPRWGSYWGASSGVFGADRLAASANFRGPGNGNVVYVRLRDDGTTNRDCSYSSSPTGPWHLIYSIGRTNGFTASGFGFGVLTQGAVARQTSMLIHGVQ